MQQEALTLEKHAYGGESMGRLADGRAVFVPFALPGEDVRVRLVEDKPRYARAELIEVLTPSDGRIQPQCQHYQQCGGCHYQHIPYEDQLAVKAEVLRDQLRRIGKIEAPAVNPGVPSPQPWNYRNQVSFQITDQGHLGFRASLGQGIIPIRECHLLRDAIDKLWPQLDIESIPGLDKVSIRLGENNDLMVILHSSDPQPVGLELDIPLSMVHSGPGGSLVMAGDDHIVLDVNQHLFRISADTFFPANLALIEVMINHLLDKLPPLAEASLVHAYCGAGLFSAFIASHVDRLVAIENDPGACQDFVANLDEFDNVELYEAPVEAVLPSLDFTPAVLIVEPPRSGIERYALDGIISLEPEMVVYLSCDPATLARDAKRLAAGGYQLQEITPFDLLPQTYQIHSISFWNRA